MIVDSGTLRAITYADPDGGSKEPTESDYAWFKGWVLFKYGVETWEAYSRGELRTSPHNENGTTDDFYG